MAFYFKSFGSIVKTIKKLTSIVAPARSFVYQGKLAMMQTRNARANNTSKATFFTTDLFLHKHKYYIKRKCGYKTNCCCLKMSYISID